MSKSNVRTSVTVSERRRLVPNPLGNVETKSWTCRKKSGSLKIQIFNDIFPKICLRETESVTVTEFEFANFQPFFFTSSWLDLTLTHWVWYTTQSFSHTNGCSDVTFAHFELISPNFRYFFESVTTMVGGSVLLAICASPIPPNTSSWTQKTRLAGHMWSLWG